LGTATVSNSTISGNGGYGIGIGICSSPPYVFCTDSTLTVTNSIVADSTGRGDCVIYSGTVTDGGHNLIDDAANSCGLTNGVKGNIVGVDPMLDPAGLKDNGGPTQTIALLPNSPAIEAGDNASCPATDQRGYARPGSGHTQCSIGAYEADAFSPEPCVGDCDGTGGVTVDEIITLVNIALGNTQPSACPHGVPSGAEVDIALILQGVNNALNGCGGG